MRRIERRLVCSNRASIRRLNREYVREKVVERLEMLPMGWDNFNTSCMIISDTELRGTSYPYPDFPNGAFNEATPLIIRPNPSKS